MSEDFVEYELRSARPAEIGRVLDFYDEQGRPPTVFRRTDAVISQTIDSGRCFILEHKREIVASASLIILPGTTAFGEDVVTHRDLSSEINIGEVASLFRRGANPPRIVADLFFAIIVLQACLYGTDLSISQLTAQCVKSEELGARLLELVAMPWHEFYPNEIYRDAFLATLEDRTEADRRNRGKALRTFYTPVSSVVDAALALVGENGVFSYDYDTPGFIYSRGRPRNSVGAADDSPSIAIDLRSTNFLQLAHAIVDKAEVLRKDLEKASWEKALCVIRSATSRAAAAPTRPPQRSLRTASASMSGMTPAAA